MTSWVHETIINFLHEHFILLFNQTYSQSRRNKIKICTNLKMDGFAKEYQDSVKTPDIGIFMSESDDAQYKHNVQDGLKWALEVGFSQEYDDLREDLRLWLIGQPTCYMTVLINITESPKYQCPLDFDLDICDKFNIPQDESQITAKDFSLQGEYGPVMFKGYQWVGQISEVFLEIWTCNRRTGQLRREGRRMSIVPKGPESPRFELADFLFIDKPQRTSFDWDEFRLKLKGCLRSYAVSRCREWLRQSRNRAGLVGDES